MTIWERVYAALSGLGVPVSASAQIVQSGAELPDTYLVYFLLPDPVILAGDDQEVLRVRTVQVSAYSRTGLATLPNVVGAMEAAGFRHGPDRELPFSSTTRHFGLAMEFQIVELKE